MERIVVTFEVTYQMLRESKFKVVPSPFTFTPEREIYKVEYDGILRLLKYYNANPLNVKIFGYQVGILSPYLLKLDSHIVTSMDDTYTVMM